MIGVAAEKIGVARSTAYSWRSDPEFLVRWNDAVATSLDRVETAMVKRAIKRSDTNAQFIMSKRRSEIYGKHDTSPTNGEREQRTLEDLALHAEVARLKDIRLVPGMPAEAFINNHERTMLQYLLKPLEEQIARTFRER